MLHRSSMVLHLPGTKDRHPLHKRLSLLVMLLSWKRFGDRQFPEDVANILSAETQKQYVDPIKRWREYCAGRSTDPYRPELKEVLTYLADLFKGGLGHSALCTHRSALSKKISIPGYGVLSDHPLI